MSYALIDKLCSFEIPQLINAETLTNNNAYILTDALKGRVLDSITSDKMVKQLANHLGELHSNPNKNWGTFNDPMFSSFVWSKRLNTTLKNSKERWGDVFLHSDTHLEQALEACKLIEVDSFVPLIPDLRCDQFLQEDNKISALVDLDAFVFAPRELDFVILEYLLSKDQLTHFSQEYSTHHEIPDIEIVRPAYRLLLFYMQILGESDLDVWMKKEVFL